MLAKLKLYAIIGLLVFSVIAGGASWFLWGQNQNLKDELEVIEISRQKAEENLELVSDQLENERLTREAAEAALTNLREVPDVDFNTPLPPSISNVLTDFRDRMQ